jgi:hypothetical protein
VYWCFNQVGVPLKRAMFDQLAQGEAIPLGPPGNRLMNAMPGDVVYFGLNNGNPAENHEGIIVSTNGAGTMVNALCTACGPIQLTPIGESSSPSEPISAIRRFNLGNIGPSSGSTIPSGNAGGTATTTASKNCVVNVPVIDLCLWDRSWNRVIIGVGCFIGAIGLGLMGAFVLGADKFLPDTPRMVRMRQRRAFDPSTIRVRAKMPTSGPISEPRPKPAPERVRGEVVRELPSGGS